MGWQDGMGEDDFGWDGVHGENTIFTEELKSTNKVQFTKLNTKYQKYTIKILQIFTKISAIITDHRALERMECTSYINRPGYRPFPNIRQILTKIQSTSNKF